MRDGAGFASLNIVEIGRPFVKLHLPQTRVFCSPMDGFGLDPGIEPLRALPGALANPGLDLVVCHAQRFSPWSLRWLLRKLGNRRTWREGLPFASVAGPQFLRLDCKAPIAVIDFEDDRFISRSDLFLLDRAALWFKRELPVDHWQVFTRTAHHGLPTGKFRRDARNSERVSKLRPLSLGAPLNRDDAYPSAPAEKSSDIFFAGTIDGSSSVRKRGLEEVMALAGLGYVIDIPQAHLPRLEFLARAAAAHLVWSPEGYGWDCFRHHEAPLCFSVPLINRPTIERHAPLEDGVHAHYYDPEPGALTRAAIAALADKSRLAQMAQAARAHVETHHSLGARVEYLVRETLGR